MLRRLDSEEATSTSLCIRFIYFYLVQCMFFCSFSDHFGRDGSGGVVSLLQVQSWL